MHLTFRLGALFAALVLILTACAGAPAGSASVAPASQAASAPAASQPAASQPAASAGGEQVEVRWFIGLGTGTDPAQVEVEQKIADAFTAANPNIKVTLEVVAYEAARDALSTEIASGNPPDIVGPVGVSGAEAFHGQWLDLQPLIDSTGYDVSQFPGEAVAYYNDPSGEGQVGLPFALFPSMLYYQREMFDEVGLEYPPHEYGAKYMLDGEEVDWDFDALHELALRLTVDNNGNDAKSADFDPANVVQWGYEPQYQDARAMGSYFGSGSLADGTNAQIPPHWLAAWEWVYKGVWEEHTIMNQAQREAEEVGGTNPFNSGNAAMALSHLWYTCCLTEAGETWDIAAVPAYNGTVTSNLNADTFRILKGSKNPDEAFQVVQYFLGDAAPELLEIYGGMPAREEQRDAYFTSLDEKFPQDVDWDVAVAGLDYPDIPSFEGYTPNYNEAFDAVVTFLNKLYSTDGLDVKAESDALKEQLQAIYDKVN